MIEKESAVADLEAMLSVEGVEMVQWGGADYSMSVGPGRPAARVPGNCRGRREGF